MDATTIAEASKNLDSLINKVNADAEATIICGNGDNKAVLMSYEEYKSWAETIYLLSNPANAEHLRKSIRQADEGMMRARKLADI